MLLVKEMPVSSAADLLDEHDGRLWRIIHHYVDAAHSRQDWSFVDTVAVDETSTRKGHKYATVVVDIDPEKERPARLLFMTQGKTAESLGEFVADMLNHNSIAEQIEMVAIDMGWAYQKGAAEHLPMAEISFDRFHVIKLAGKAVDHLRQELKKQGASRGTLPPIQGDRPGIGFA